MDNYFQEVTAISLPKKQTAHYFKEGELLKHAISTHLANRTKWAESKGIMVDKNLHKDEGKESYTTIKTERKDEKFIQL